MRKFFLLSLSGLMFGCGSIAMQDEHYEYFAGLGAGIQKCHEAGYMDQELYTNAETAWHYLVDTWFYDSGKLTAMLNQEYQSVYPTTNDCNLAKNLAFDMIASANKHHANAQAITAANRSMAQRNATLRQQASEPINLPEVYQPGSFGSDKGYSPQQFYTPDDCIGYVVYGICRGTVKPSARPGTCHGTILNGECKGVVVGDGG